MEKALQGFLLTAVISLTAINVSNAQNAKNVPPGLLPPPANINIDGSIKEWGDSLRYFNVEKKLNYSLANDKEYLYAVISVNDRLEQVRVLNAGITLSIDPHGKKKSTFSLTFPLGTEGEKPDFGKLKSENGDITQADRDELMRERVTKLRNIKVEGFKDIEGDMITTSNTYGIKAAIDYDAVGNLIYEMAIPLKFFHADDVAKNEWAFNFKINGFERQAPGGGEPGGSGFGEGGGGRGGRGGGMGGGGGRGGRGGGGGRGGAAGGGDRSELSKSIDFWEKYYLNTK